MRISAIVTGCFGHRDRFAAALDTGDVVLLRTVTISQVVRAFISTSGAHSAHRVSAQLQAMRAVQEPIQNGIRHRGFSDVVMPVFHW